MSAFDKVIGYLDIKTEMIRFADVLMNMDQYKKLGVTMPRGILLYGEPGIGKTLMAKCFIEESGCKAFTVRKDKPDGDFVNVIRYTFDKAKKESLAIVFLDDMDKFANEDQFHKDAEEYVVVQSCIDDCNGRFYLIANYDKYENIAHFRIDKMTEVRILNEKIKPMSQIPELEKGLNLPKHMAEHLYMFSGESVSAEIKTTPDMMSELVDWFGTDFSIVKKSEEFIIARVRCNAEALRFWALQYGPYAEIIKPDSVRNQLQKDVSIMVEKYL